MFGSVEPEKGSPETGDFRRDGNPLDLANVVSLTFLFGPAHGSLAGRIGLDQLEFTHD